LLRENEALKEENEALKEENEALKKENEALIATLKKLQENTQN
jgi:cell division protein FtsB